MSILVLVKPLSVTTFILLMLRVCAYQLVEVVSLNPHDKMLPEIVTSANLLCSK